MTRPPRQIVQTAIASIAEATGVSPDRIIQLRGDATAIRARWQVWGYLDELGYSRRAIAAAWGCEHTTVGRAMRRAA